MLALNLSLPEPVKVCVHVQAKGRRRERNLIYMFVCISFAYIVPSLFAGGCWIPQPSCRAESVEFQAGTDGSSVPCFSTQLQDH